MRRAEYSGLPVIMFLPLLLLICGCSLGQSTDKSEGCVKDSECKGERICESGVCVDPDGGDSDTDEAEAEAEAGIECSGAGCEELLAFCLFVSEQGCSPEIGGQSDLATCMERAMGYRDSGCFDGANLAFCLGDCADRARFCGYIEMCTDDCISQYCL